MLQITAANRSDCEDKCLNEFSFVCRSANFDSSLRSCSLSRFTRRTHPELLEDDPNSDYLENTCLNGMCNQGDECQKFNLIVADFVLVRDY